MPSRTLPAPRLFRSGESPVDWLAALSDEELLAELGDAPADAADRMRGLVAAVGVLRGMAPPADTPEDDDVVDPYRLPDEVFDRMASQLRPGLDAVVRLAHLAEP